MPTFNIIKKSEVENTFRVQKIMAEFDVKKEHCQEHFEGEIKLPDKWNIGLIVGKSGTGKSTIAKEIFGGALYTVNADQYKHSSVIDDMPANVDFDTIQKMFYKVGFASVPSWLKPYKVLSTGEKMRVDLANSLLLNDKVVFDEFTSVVDRQVAEVICIALSRYLKKQEKKQFIAVSCHSDIIPYLQPDWIFNTDTMQMVFQDAQDLKCNSTLENVAEVNGQNLGVITI